MTGRLARWRLVRRAVSGPNPDHQTRGVTHPGGPTSSHGAVYAPLDMLHVTCGISSGNSRMCGRHITRWYDLGTLCTLARGNPTPISVAIR